MRKQNKKNTVSILVQATYGSRFEDIEVEVANGTQQQIHNRAIAAAKKKTTLKSTWTNFIVC